MLEEKAEVLKARIKAGDEGIEAIIQEYEELQKEVRQVLGKK